MPLRAHIDDRYTDASGVVRSIAADVIEHLQDVIGPEPDDAPGPLVVRPGAAVGRAAVVLEDGTAIDVDGPLPSEVPIGYHRLDDGTTARLLIVTPGACHLPRGWRAWGWAAQLYASRSRRSWGIGDLGDLDRLARWASDRGAGFMMINPLHAAAPVEPQQPSPYSPTSRRFLNPLYIDVDAIRRDLGQPDSAIDDLARLGRALNERRIIDRDQVVRLKLGALQRLWQAGPAAPQFDRWCDERGASLRGFAVWSVLAETFGGDWRSWPAEFRRPDSRAIEPFAAEHHDRVRFHMWLQWLLTRQLHAVQRTIGLVQDLPIGFDAGGADAWLWQDLLAGGVSVGAPPDEFNTSGQDWGLPPFVPWKLRAADYRPFIETIRATFATHGGLRIDHVMGLFRLWWIPDGAGPARGAYVRYPAHDLLDILALESVRHQAVVVGEDLGTVEDGVREQLAERNVLSYRVLWFEEDPPPAWPAKAMAAVTTHDLPTVAGLWDGSDLDALRELNLDPQEEATAAIRDRLATQGRLTEGATNADAVLAAHDLVGSSPAVMLCATLDDACAVTERPNIPGASAQRPNWSLALPVPIEDLATSPVAQAIAERFSSAVGAAPGGLPEPVDHR